MGMLRALVGGAWVDVPNAVLGVQEGPRGPAGIQGVKGNEVVVSASDPGTAYDLWIDTENTQQVAPWTASRPLGYMGHKIATASAWTNATATATALTVTSGDAPSITFTAVVNRYYLARWYAPIQSSVAGDVWETTIAVTGLSNEVGPLRIPAAATTVPTAWMERLFQTSGVVTASVLARRVSGTGTLSLAGVAADSPMAFYVEDIGGF